MDLSDYASKLAVKGLYLCANTLLDILIALMKRLEKHIERLERDGEKTYTKRGLHKISSFIEKRELNKLNLEISEIKFEIRGLDKEIEKCDKIIKTYELQKEKENINLKLKTAEELIYNIKMESPEKPISENQQNIILDTQQAIEKYKENIQLTESKINQIGIAKDITEEKYNKFKLERTKLLEERENKQEHMENCLDKKIEIKEKIDSLDSNKLVNNNMELTTRKKELQEELDVINRKINNDKNISVKEESKVNDIIKKESEEESIEIKDIKEDKEKDEKENQIDKNDNVKKNEVKESVGNKEKIVDISVATKVGQITSIEQGMKEIRNAYRDMKIMAIDNPELLDDPKYKKKFKQAEKLMQKYDLFDKDTTKVKIKVAEKEVAR